MGLLHDPFDRSRLPADFDRRRRVRLIGEAAAALLDGHLPTAEQRLFLAGGLMSWLERGGDLLTDFWAIKSPQGSRHTAPALWRAHLDERHAGDGAAASASSTSDLSK